MSALNINSVRQQYLGSGTVMCPFLSYHPEQVSFAPFPSSLQSQDPNQQYKESKATLSSSHVCSVDTGAV